MPHQLRLSYRNRSRRKTLPTLLLPALILHAFASAHGAASADLSTAVDVSPLSVHEQLSKDRAEAVEPYLYGVAIAGSICAWKWRQTRRREQAMS